MCRDPSRRAAPGGRWHEICKVDRHTEPFRIDDQIVFQAFEGTEEDIRVRTTTIRTYDGRQVVIPNAELFTNEVTVRVGTGGATSAARTRDRADQARGAQGTVLARPPVFR